MEKESADISFDFSPNNAFAESEESQGNTDEQETTTPEGSPPEENEAEADPSQEGEESSEEESESSEEAEDENTLDANDKQPLNKDKRWQEKLAKERELLQKNVQMEQQLQEYRAMVDKLTDNANQNSSNDEEIPKVFLEAFGQGDPEQDKKGWNAFKGILDFQKQNILNELAQQKAEEEKKVQEWNSWVDQQVATYQSQGESITKDDFIKIVNEFEPSNKLQSYDPEKVIEIHRLKKEIADLKVANAKEKQKEVSVAKKQNASGGSTMQGEQKETFTLDDSSAWKNILRK